MSRNDILQGLHKLYYPYIDIVTLRGKDINYEVDEGGQKLAEYVTVDSSRKEFYRDVTLFIRNPHIWGAATPLEVAGQAYDFDHYLKNEPKYQ